MPDLRDEMSVAMSDTSGVSLVTADLVLVTSSLTSDTFLLNSLILPLMFSTDCSWLFMVRIEVVNPDMPRKCFQIQNLAKGESVSKPKNVDILIFLDQ